MSKGDYVVGYKKPPAEHQFQQGVSGNPNGRKRGAKGLKTILRDELKTKVLVTESGKTKKIAKAQVLIMTLMNKALKGDMRAMEQVIGMAAHMFGVEDEVLGNAPLSARDQELLESFLNDVGPDLLAAPDTPDDD